MNQSAGWATLDVIPSVKGLRSELERQTGSDLDRVGKAGGERFGEAAGKAGGARFGAVFKKAATAGLIGLAAAGAGAIKLGVDAVGAASDLEESTNKVAQVFGDAADRIFTYTEKAGDALGQTNTQAREAAATFGIFGSAAGLADRKNARFAKRMTTLASDLASFNNTSPDQAIEALGAALRGESEPIRAYGVLLDEATLKAEAMRLGLLKPTKDASKIRAYQVRIMEGQQKYNEAVKEHGKNSLEALKAEASLGTSREQLRKATEGTIPPLTNQQKLLAAQSEIFKQTKVAQGDFARTSDGLANQQRRLAARFEDAKARLGKGLLPIMTDAADFLLDKGIPAFEGFSDWFTEDGVPAIEDFYRKSKPALRFVRDLVGAFSELPTEDKLAALGSTLAGGVVVKHQLGKLFERGGPANPMFVVVTNQGFGAGASGGPAGAAGRTGATGATAAAATRWGTLAGAAMKAGIIGGGIVVADMLLPDPKKNRILDPIGDSADKTREWFLDKTNLGRNPLPDKPEKWAADWATGLDASRAKAAGFGRELDLVGSRKINPQINTGGMKPAKDMLVDFIGLQIDAGAAVTPYINTTSIERAIQMAKALNDALPGSVNVNAGVDNSAPYVRGGGTSADPGKNPSNGRGPLVHIDNVQAHDYGDFMSQLQRRTQTAGLGGIG